jgi:hypothetical protein
MGQGTCLLLLQLLGVFLLLLHPRVPHGLLPSRCETSEMSVYVPISNSYSKTLPLVLLDLVTDNPSAIIANDLFLNHCCVLLCGLGIGSGLVEFTLLLLVVLCGN